MSESIFNKDFFNISGERIELRLIDTYEGEGGSLPFYWWDIVLKPENVSVGKISFRIGHNYHSYYNGNIGYEVDEEYRGNHYSLQACRLLTPVAKYYGMDKIYLSCDYDNAASYKTIERLGAKLVEEVAPPEDYIYYYEGMPKQRIYELKIDNNPEDTAMNKKIKLIVPTIENKEEALRFRQSFFDAGERTIDGSELLGKKESYEEWLSYITDNASAESVRNGCVLTDTYFAVDCNDNIVGIIDFRHELNDFFKDFGHSGYSVLPAKRRKGYATEMLRLIVEKAKADGLREIQLSALRSNIPSVKTIKNNGGVLVRSFEFHGNIADVFVIRL